MPGTDLAALLHHERRLDPTQTLELLRQVASALDAAHARGIVHRDVKPGNVLIASGEGDHPAGHCLLTDFGLSKRSTGGSVALTAPGDFVGTLNYTAPEVILGKDSDHRVDVYALGCVLYECLAGAPPFIRDRETDLLYAHVDAEPPKVSAVRGDLPPALDGVVGRAMAKEPDDRFSSCGAVIAAAAVLCTPPRLSLDVTAGKASGTTIDVGAELVLGRDVAGAGQLGGDSEISRRHARIWRGADGVYVIGDLGSTNGTFANGERLEHEYALAPGDTIEVGATTLVVRQGAAVQPPEPDQALPAALAEPSRHALRIEVDWDARELRLELDEDSEPVTLLYEDGRWRVKPPG